MANPIIDTDVANSAPGVPQPIIVSGGESLPPSFPIAPAGTWLPPPTVGNPVGVPTFPPETTEEDDGQGGTITVVGTAPVPVPATTPFATPVVPPGTGDPGIPQPQIATGPSLPPSFPLYTAPGPVQPIVLTGQMNIGNASTVPTTPGTQPITIMTSLVNATAPVIEGEPNVGETLELTPGVWNGPANMSYQWMSDGAPIADATGSTYELTESDLGAEITVIETATNLMGAGTAISNAIGPIEAAIEPASAGAAASPYTGVHQRLAEELASARGIRKTPPKAERDDWKPTSGKPKKKR